MRAFDAALHGGTLGAAFSIMGRAHLRIIAAIFALLVLAGTIFGAYYFLEKTVKPEQSRIDTVATLRNQKNTGVDPGKKEFGRALEAIRRHDFDTARAKLNQILEIYTDSASSDDARRVLGEMNADLLFSIADSPGNLKGTQEYTVARGQSLAGIAQKYGTTIPFIQRINNLVGGVIKPDERLVLYPLNFSLTVDLQRMRITAERDGAFFKDYAIQEHHIEGRIAAQTTVADLQGAGQQSAKKVIRTSTKGGRNPVNFSGPAEKNADGSDPHGIFLAEEDIAELSTLLRAGTPVVFVKPKT